MQSPTQTHSTAHAQACTLTYQYFDAVGWATGMAQQESCAIAKMTV